MKLIKRILNFNFVVLAALAIAFLFSATPSFAQKSAQKSAQRTTGKTAGKKRLVKRAESYSQLSVGFSMWQESIEATKGADKSHLVMQSVGAKVGITFNKFFEDSHWRRAWSWDAMFGTIKGKSFDHPAIQDELEKQPWLALSGSYGLLYRTSPVSEVGFFLPVIARSIQWDINDGSALKMDREFSFSAGLGGVYINRFTPTQSLVLSVAHQQMWNSTAWTASWDQTY